jgi:hypothetical protein
MRKKRPKKREKHEIRRWLYNLRVSNFVEGRCIKKASKNRFLLFPKSENHFLTFRKQPKTRIFQTFFGHFCDHNDNLVFRQRVV